MKGSLSFAATLLFLAGIPGCGAVFDPSAVVIAINVTPGLTSARVGSSVTFSVNAIYSDGHTASVESDVSWTHDSHSWVTWSDSTAQCVAPSPVFFGAPERAQITATATIDGNAFSDHSGIECTP